LEQIMPEELERLKEENAYLRRNLAEANRRLEDLGRYRKTFEHVHVNDQSGTDTCAKCGLDLRDPIHKRWITK
jgi:hypothetical protein